MQGVANTGSKYLEVDRYCGCAKSLPELEFGSQTNESGTTEEGPHAYGSLRCAKRPSFPSYPIPSTTSSVQPRWPCFDYVPRLGRLGLWAQTRKIWVR